MSAAAMVIPAMVLASVLLVLGLVGLAVVVIRRTGTSDRWFARAGGSRGGTMTHPDEAGYDVAADRSAAPVERLGAAGMSAPRTKAGDASTKTTSTNATGTKTAGTRAAGTSRLGAVLLLIGITASSLLIYLTDWPWWAVFALVALPFLTASVWCEIGAVKRAAAEDAEYRGRSTQ